MEREANMAIQSVSKDFVVKHGIVVSTTATFNSRVEIKSVDPTLANANQGALTVAGGVGIAKDLYVGTTATFHSAAVINGTTTATSTATGALVVAGGVGIGDELHVKGKIYSGGIEVQVVTEPDTLDDVVQRGNSTTGTIYASTMYSNGDTVITTASIVGQLGIDVSIADDKVYLGILPGTQGLSVDFGQISDLDGPIAYDFGLM